MPRRTESFALIVITFQAMQNNGGICGISLGLGGVRLFGFSPPGEILGGYLHRFGVTNWGI